MHIWPFRKREQKSSIDISKWAPWMSWWGDSSGVSVTHLSAIRVTAVLACARVISEDIAKHPLNTYKRVNTGKKLAVDDHIYQLLKSRPNGWQTSFEWRECMTLHAVLTGDAFSYIVREPHGKVISLRPLMPHWVTVEQDAVGMPIYKIRLKETDAPMQVEFQNMFHLRGPSWDTVTGLDAVGQARDAIGLSMAAEKTQTKLHQNGTRPAGILTTVNKLDTEALDRLKDAWVADNAGIENNFKTIVVDNGIEWKATGQTGVDSQHLETRAYQVEEIARAFKVFPQMIGHSDKTSTYASAEAFFSAHHEHTMFPWYTRWEQTLDRDVLDGTGPLFCKFEINRVLMAALKDQAEYFRALRELGGLNPNEIREMIGRDPRTDPGGEEYLTPLNMMTNGDTDET